MFKTFNTEQSAMHHYIKLDNSEEDYFLIYNREDERYEIIDHETLQHYDYEYDLDYTMIAYP
jgi:hypothetical protein